MKHIIRPSDKTEFSSGSTWPAFAQLSAGRTTLHSLQTLYSSCLSECSTKDRKSLPWVEYGACVIQRWCDFKNLSAHKFSLHCFGCAVVWRNRCCAPKQRNTTVEVCCVTPAMKARCGETLGTTTATWLLGYQPQRRWSSPSAWTPTTPEPWTALPT